MEAGRNYLEELLDTAQHRPDAHTLAALAAAGVRVDRAAAEEPNSVQQRTGGGLTAERGRQRSRDRRKRHGRERRRHDEGSGEEGLAGPARRSGRDGSRRDHPHEGIPPQDRRRDDRSIHGGPGTRRDADTHSRQGRRDGDRDTRLLGQQLHSPRQPLAPHTYGRSAHQQRQLQQQGHGARPGSDSQASGYADGSWLQLQAGGARRWQQELEPEPEPEYRRQTQQRRQQEERGPTRQHDQQQYYAN